MWKTDLVLMLRSLIGDLDSSKYTDERLEQVLVVAAYAVLQDASFSTSYVVSVGSVKITPDPVNNNDKNFTILILYRSACILIGSEVKTESSNAISIKDGPSAIDLRGVSQSLNILYNKLCKDYQDLLTAYLYANGSNGEGPPGAAVLGPYSPASVSLNAYTDSRGFEFY